MLRIFIFLTVSASVGFSHDTTRINQINKKVLTLRETHLDSALRFSLRAQRMADSINYVPGLATALENMGWIYYRRGMFTKSIDHSLQALRLARQLKDPVRLANLHNNIGAVYYAQKQYAVAAAEFRKGLDLVSNANQVNTRWRTLNNISFIYVKMGLYDSAELYSNQAMAIASPEDNRYLASFAYRNQGDIYSATGRKREALLSFQTAMKLAEAAGATSLQVATRPRMAALLLEAGDTKAGIALLEQNIQITRAGGFDEELLQTYKALAQAWIEQEEYARASRIQLEYNALNDSISKRKWSDQVAALETRYELDLKEARIELLTREAALQHATIFRQRVLLWGASLGIAILTLVGIVSWNYTRKLRQAKKEIEKNEHQLTERNREIDQQRMELERLNATKDKLFSIIGHDFRSPLQSLRGLLTLMNHDSLTRQEFAYHSRDLKGRIDIVYDNLDNLLHWSVAQINGIKIAPQVVEVGQLFDEIGDLYQDVALHKKVMIRNELTGALHVVADRDHLRLVLRNLVSNAIKFSHENGTVILGGEIVGSVASLFVKDTGLGMNEANLNRLFVKDSLWSQRGTRQEKGLGIGLLLCQEFLEKANSKLEVFSQHGVGTTFTFTLTLPGTDSLQGQQAVA